MSAAVTHWLEDLYANPLPWLLEETTPHVRHLALRLLLDRPADDPEVLAMQAAAMRSVRIAAILAAQHPAGGRPLPRGPQRERRGLLPLPLRL